MASSIFPARAALFVRLDAATWPGGKPLVSFGSPRSYEDHEVVAVLGFGPTDDDPAAIGQRRQTEEYLIEVGIKVHHPDATNGQSVEARMAQLYDVVWAEVLASQDMDATVTWCHPAGTDSSEGAMPAQQGGWVMFASMSIRCVARISA